MSELDKHVKVKVVQDVLEIVQGNYNPGKNEFVCINDDMNDEDYRQYNVVDDIRKIFEYLEFYQCPEYISQEQFIRISTFEGMTNTVINMH